MKIKSSLLDSYGSRVIQKSSTDYIIDFQNCKYDSDEGIAGLVCRLRSLAEKAYSGLQPTTVEDLVKRQCMSLLPQSFKATLQFQSVAQPDLSLSEIVRLGSALEKSCTVIDISEASRSQSVKPKSGRKQQEFSSGKSSENNKTEFKKKECSYCKKSGHMKEECYRLNRLCYRCGKSGHFAPDCDVPSSRPNQTDRSQSKNSSDSSDMKVTRSAITLCGFCGDGGHLMAQCSSFKKFMEETIQRMSSSTN